jgi:hypothetical protein
LDDYYDIAELQEEQHRPRDPAIDDAIERLHTFFEAAPQRLFYSTQIETSLEREFFHWIVGKALLELGIRAGSPEFQRSSRASGSTFTLTASIVTYVGNLERWLTFSSEYLIRNSRMQSEGTES